MGFSLEELEDDERSTFVSFPRTVEAYQLVSAHGARGFMRESVVSDIKATRVVVRAAVAALTPTRPNYIEYKDKLKSEIDNLLITHGEENWDGEGALPIVPNAVNTAKRIVDYLPDTSIQEHIPNVCATLHGEIDFTYVINRNMMLTISVDHTGEVVYSGILDISKTEKNWKDCFPYDVSCWFNALDIVPANIDE